MITKPIIDPVMDKKFKFVLKQLRKSKEEEEYANSVFKAFSYGKNIRKMGDLPNIKTTLKSLYGKYFQSSIYSNLATIRKYNRKPKIKFHHEGEDFTQYFHLHSLQHLTSGTNHLQIKWEVDRSNRSQMEALSKTVCRCCPLIIRFRRVPNKSFPKYLRI